MTRTTQSRSGGTARERAPSLGRAPPRRREGRLAIAALALIVGAVVCANLAASRIAVRIDLTGDHIYTLSDASRAMVRSLPDPLTVKAYFSNDLPPAQAATARYARELLEEYRLSSDGNLQYIIEDPASNPRLEEQAGRCRVGKVAIETRNGAKLEVAQRFLGLCLWYDGQSRALAPIDGGAGLEYQISALIKLMSQRRRKIAFTVGHGERDLGTDYTFVRRALEHEQDIVTIDLASGTLGDDVDLLVVAGPRRPFDDRARREIEAFLSKGRPAVFLLDGMAWDDGAARTGADDPINPRAIESGLEPLLDAYGFQVGHDLVFDRRNVPGPIAPADAAGAPMLVNFPAFVVVKLDPASASTGQPSIAVGIDALVFPFASSLEVAGQPAAGSARAPGQTWTLARSSNEAWSETHSFLLPPAAGAGAPAARRRSFALAAAYQGPVRSAPPTGGARAGATRAVGAGATPVRSVRLVIVADSDFVSDRHMELMRTLPIYAGGAELLLNAVSWALEDDALTTLRARVLRARPLDIDGDGDGGGERAALLEWGNVIGVPLALCAAGLLRWRSRLANRRRQRLPDAPSGAP